MTEVSNKNKKITEIDENNDIQSRHVRRRNRKAH